MIDSNFSILAITDDSLSQIVKETVSKIGGCKLDFGSDKIEKAIGNRELKYDLVLFDPELVSMLPSDYVMYLKACNPMSDVVLILAERDITIDIELMKMGAYDSLRKDFSLEELSILITGLMEKSEKERENLAFIDAFGKGQSQTIVCHSMEMEKVLSMAARAAKSDTAVLLEGESGTGKELIARAIHMSGTRRYKPFVPVNISSLSEKLIESELFGFIKGAFTGAMSDRSGRVAISDGGTLFIDEIADIPPGIQVKLLRLLQLGSYERVGDSTSHSVNVRIIAATSKDLEAEVREGRFRADLYYRINVVPVILPPLRNHRSDIPYLVDYFINKFSSINKKEVKGITAEAMALLMKYSFPGNIRELENAVERGVVLCRGEYLTETDVFVPEGETEKTPELRGPYDEVMTTFEKGFLQKVLERNGFNKSAAARELCINERRLRYRLKLLGLD